MISDYSRVAELSAAAYDSAGAGQAQYEKTLDSLETKLAKLKNSWDEFLMGLSNNEAIKFVVSLLDSLLTTLNKIISTLSGNSGLLKTVFSVMTVVGSFKLGKSILGKNGSAGILGSIFGKKGDAEQAGKTTAQHFSNGFAKEVSKKGLIKAIFNKEASTFSVDLGRAMGKTFSFKDWNFDFSQVSKQDADQYRELFTEQLKNNKIVEDKNLLPGFDYFWDKGDYNTALQYLAKFGIQATITGEDAKKMGIQIQGTSPNFKALQVSAGVAAGALMSLGTLFDSLGNEKIGAIFRGIGTAIMGIIPAISMVQNAMVTGAKTVGSAISASLGWISVVISAVIGLVQIIKAVWPESEQEKLEKLEDTQQKLAEGAKSAQEAYDNLNSSLSELSEAKETLDGLVQGTLEWKKQLLQVNSQVLELINKYPQLEYARGQNGLLEITDSSIDAAIKAQYKAAENANALSAFGQLAVSGQKVGARQDELDDAITEAVTHSVSASEEILREKIENDPNWRVTEEFASQTRMSSEAMDGLNQALDNVSQSLLELDSQAKAYSATIYGGRAKGYEDTSYYNQILEGAAIANSDQVSEVTDKYIEAFEAWSPSTIVGTQDSAIEIVAQQLGVTDQSGSLRTYQEVLSKITGQTMAEIEKLYTDEDSIIPVLAEAMAMMRTGNNIPQLFKKMSGASDQKQASLYAGLYSGGGDLSLGQAKSFDREEAQQFLEQNNLTALEFGYDTIEELLDSWEQTAENNIASFSQSQGQLERALGGGTWGYEQQKQASLLMEGQSLQSTQAYFDQLTQLYARGGKEAVSAFQNSFTGLLSIVPESQKQKVMDIVTSTDFSDLSDVELMFEEIEKVAPGTVGQLGGMEKAIVELGKATKKVNLETTLSEVKSLLDLADDIEERDRSQGLSQEELDQVVKAGAADYSDFFFTGQEFIPVTDSMESLADAIRANTDAILEETMTRLKQQIGSGEYVEELFDNANWGSAPADQKERIMSGEATATDWQIVRDVLGMGGASQEEVMAKYRSYMPDYLNLAENRQQLEDYGNYAAQAEAYQKDPQELFNRAKTVTGIMTNNAEDAPNSWVKNENYDANAEQYLDAQVAANSLDKTVEKLTDDYRENGNTILSNSKIMKAHALRWNNSEKKIKTLCETVKDTTEAFNAGTKALENGETPANDYNIALEKIKKAGQDAFGKGFDDKFIQENSELVAQLAEGGEVGAAAFDQIQQKISSETLEQLQNFNQQLLNSEELMAELNGVESEFKVNGTADVTQLMQMLMNAGYTADEVAEKIEALTGATVTYDVEYQYVDLPIGSGMDAQGQIQIGQGKRNGKLGFEKVAIPHVIKAVGSKNSYPSNFSGGSSGGGGGGSEKLWENPYDELYNLTEKINEALRQREKLEREYDRILERRGSTYQELRANYDSQLASLEKEIEYQKELQAGRKRQLDKLSSETYADEEGNQKSFADWGATNYASYDQVAGVIRIDWSGIDKITDTEKGGAIEAYISRLEELQDQFEKTQETIEDMQDTVEELKKDQMDEYLEFEQKVYDAIVNREQKVIDDFQSISDKLAEENNKILDSLQESIDLERQIRDNTKTEEDINEKEARLAYLRRDTSNANLLEIKQLEEELADSRQSYSDTLVDQKISELQNQNEKAQEAREKQIELMQVQLDHDESEGVFWEKTMGFIKDALVNGKFQEGSALAELLKNDEGFQGLSKFGQLDWSEEIAQGFLAAMHGYTNWKQYEAENITYSAKLANGTNLSYNPETKKWTDSSGAEYSDVHYNAESGAWESSSIGTPTGGYDAQVDYAKKIISAFNSGNVDEVRTLERQRDAKIDATSSPYGKTKGKVADALAAGLTAPLDTENSDYKKNYENAWASGNYFDAIKFEALRNRKLSALGKGAQNEILEALFKKEGKVFKTGGLADFTGPAWLDGTRSKPELILNAHDTENLIQLKDVLGSFMRGSTAAKEQKSGDNYFDIDINVEEISDDYDVDRLAERVKEQINSESRYRNVNAISFLR